MSTETAVLPTGALGRVTEDHTLDQRRIFKGSTFEVEDYVSSEEAEDGIPFYWCSNNGGLNNLCVLADKVELVKTAEQMYARRIPTAEEIIAELDCLDDYEDFRIDAAESPDGNSREISGRTKDGLFFACTITVSNVYQGDF